MAGLSALAAIVSACSHVEVEPTPTPVKFLGANVPPEARKPCPAPVFVPDRDMTQSEVFTGWKTDRTSLQICEIRRAGAVSAIEGGSR